MAIKGKGKTRPRQVTRGPKPAYHPVRPPLFRRRWVQLILAAVVGAGLVFLGTWIRDGLRGYSEDQERSDRELQVRTTVNQYKGRIDTALSGVGTAQPPSTFLYLPQFTDTLDQLHKGNVGDGGALDAARSVQTQAAQAADAIGQIDTASLIRDKGFSLAMTVYAVSAPRHMTQALQLSERAAELVEQALGLSGSQRERLLKVAQETHTTASELFAGGYSDFVELQRRAGVFNVAAATAPSG